MDTNVNFEPFHKIMVVLIMAGILLKRIFVWVFIRYRSILLVVVWFLIASMVFSLEGQVDNTDYLMLLLISFVGITQAMRGL